MTANADMHPIDGERRHDPLCYVAQNGGTCCPWMGSCNCQCMCDYITKIRNDTLDKVIEAISEYHQKAQGFEEYCFDCYEDWPCPTVEAIENLRSKGSAENTNETL